MSFLARAGLIGTWAALLPGLAAAAVFTVNSTSDLPDASPGDGACDAGSGACTLRAAVQEANQTPGSDTINVPAGVFILTRTGADEEASLLGDLDLLESVQTLGWGGDKARHAVIPHYADLLRHVFERLGWDDARFRGYRCEIDYPIYGSQVAFAFDPAKSVEDKLHG